jgi:Gnt-I system high-affinity gluconate transporter
MHIAIPMLAPLSVAHGFLPPHPSPSALVLQFHANMGLTLLYGIIISIPTIIIAGPLFSNRLKSIPSSPIDPLYMRDIREDQLPGAGKSFISSLLPVILLMVTTVFLFLIKEEGLAKNITMFIGEPGVVMLIAIIVATYLLGTSMGKSIKSVMDIYGDAVKDVAMLLLIIGGAGILKQIFMDSGVSEEIGTALKSLNMPPLFLGWLIAAVIRVCLGSATIAGLTTASIVVPMMATTHVDPNLMVLSIGAGSLMFSHVNDGGFWLFKEYFNLSIKDTLRSWSLMETIISIIGLAGVLILNLFIG